MFSASSNLAPRTTCAGSPIGRGASCRQVQVFALDSEPRVDVSNRLDVGKRSNDGGSIPPGASNHGPVVQWQDFATLRMTSVLKCCWRGNEYPTKH